MRRFIKKSGDNPNGQIDWGNELVHAGQLSLHVVYRILSYFLNIVITILLIGLITGIIVGTVFALYVRNYVDTSLDMSLFVSSKQDITTRIFYYDYESIEDRQNRNGEVVELEDESLHGSVNSLWADYSEMPNYLIEAFVSYEDHRFWSHNGVDWLTTGKAFINYFIPIFSDNSFGASTITQQLIKNVTQEDEVKIDRKVKEIFRALNLEKEKSKEEILELYLNIIYMSNNCRGVKTAAKTYFGKSLDQLTLVECASLAAIVKNPSQYEPKYHPINNKEQRDTVLLTMYNYGKITYDEYLDAINTELVIVDSDDTEDNDSTTDIFSWYTDALFNEVRDALVEKYNYSEYAASLVIYNSGLQIYSVMDPDVQSILEDVYANDSEYFPNSGDGMQPESAMVIIDPYTGDIVALVGGRGEKLGNRLLNHATMTKRPPGSSIKPLSIYAPAIDEGLITWGTVLDDTPLRFDIVEKDDDDESSESESETEEEDIVYKPYPQNYDKTYGGLTTVCEALRVSLNTLPSKILDLIGAENSYNFIKYKLHMDSVNAKYEIGDRVLSDIDYAPLALGQFTYGVTVAEITAAYSIFVNNGIYNEPRMYTQVLDSNGNVILGDEKVSEIVISDQTATIMTKLLQNVVNNGTGAAAWLRYTVDVAGKTGTSQDDYDRWFIGYTPYYIGGVWFGYEINETLNSFGGANPALNVWNTVMTKIHQPFIDAANSGEEPLKKFVDAPGIVTAQYCKDSGKLCTDACDHDPRGNRSETGYFTRDTVPTEYCDVHVEVTYDNVFGGIVLNKNEYTGNKNNLITVSLLNVKRVYPMQIYVKDAQYTFFELPDNIKPGTTSIVPFYTNCLGEKEYFPLSNTYDMIQYNRFAYLHYDFSKWEKLEEESRENESASNDESTSETH